MKVLCRSSEILHIEKVLFSIFYTIFSEMSSSSGPSEHRGQGRHKGFSFATGSLVLVKWDDGMVYFAKIKRINQKKEKCTVVFDDKSQDEADFSQIHSGEGGGCCLFLVVFLF